MMNGQTTYSCVKYTRTWMEGIEISSYIAHYPVLGTAQSALHFTPDRPVHSNAISTSLGSIQPHCNYCTKTIHSDIHQSIDKYSFSE